MHAPTTTMSFFGQRIPQNSKTDGVHSYLSFGENDARTKPKFHQHACEKSSPAESSAHTEGRRKRANLSPFKLEFDIQQKPMKIQVFYELVKDSNRLNANAVSYSTHPQPRHMLLVFANDSSTYEILFTNSSWPNLIWGLQFKVTSPQSNSDFLLYSGQSCPS